MFPTLFSDRRFQFYKRSQLVIRAHNVTLSFAADGRQQRRLFDRRNPRLTRSPFDSHRPVSKPARPFPLFYFSQGVGTATLHGSRSARRRAWFPEKDDAIDYAQGRACFRSGEIRILDSSGSVERVIPFDETNRSM
jgi:hypothetical protein